MTDDQTAEGGRGPLCGNADDGVFVLALRDVRGARQCAERTGGGDVVLVVAANVGEITGALLSQGIRGVVVDWVPGQPVVEEVRSLSA